MNTEFRIASLTSVVCALALSACTHAHSEGHQTVSNAAASSETCMEVVLTGTMGGPSIFNGLAGSGTLVRYGSVANNCGDVKLQFDVGRGTSLRLSEVGVAVNQLDAVFITHLHSDHTVGLVDLLQTRWHFFGKPLDLVCSVDKYAEKPSPRTLSCANFADHIADAAEQGGEIAQRSIESKKRNSEGPSSVANVISVDYDAKLNGGAPIEVWKSGDVSVLAIESKHIPGHLSYRVNTPSGSVVIGGDAGNDLPAPPRPNSTSAAVEALAQDADVLVHSTMHPIFGPGQGSSFPAPIFYRQSTASDLGALAERAKVSHLMLTHLIPPLGAASVGPYKVPGGALSEQDYQDAVAESNYQGAVYVGKDKLTIRLPISE